MQDILTSISEIESNIEFNRAFKIMLNDSFTELQFDFSVQTQAINDQIRSQMQIKEDVEENRYSVQNITDMLSVFNTERETSTAVIDDINERLSKLALVINATDDLHHHLELRVSSLEGNIPFCILYFAPDKSFAIFLSHVVYRNMLQMYKRCDNLHAQ